MSADLLEVARDYCEAFCRGDFERLAGLIDPQDRVDFQQANLEALSLLERAGFATGLSEKFDHRSVDDLSRLTPEAFLKLFLSHVLGDVEGLVMSPLEARRLSPSEGEVEYQVESFTNSMSLRLAPYGWRVRLRDDMSVFTNIVRKATGEFLARAEKDQIRDPDEPLIPYQLCGFQDVEGNTVIEARFEQVEPFSGGRAAVRMMDRWGYIDHRGRMVIPVRYLQVTGFQEERAFVCQTNDDYQRKWALIDDSGRLLSGFVFDEVSEFWNGRAAASDASGLWGYLDREGRWAIAPAYQQALAFYETSAWVLHAEKGELYLDRDGNEVAPPERTTWDEDDDPMIINLD